MSSAISSIHSLYWRVSSSSASRYRNRSISRSSSRRSSACCVASAAIIQNLSYFRRSGKDLDHVGTDCPVVGALLRRVIRALEIANEEPSPIPRVSRHLGDGATPKPHPGSIGELSDEHAVVD